MAVAGPDGMGSGGDAVAHRPAAAHLLRPGWRTLSGGWSCRGRRLASAEGAHRGAAAGGRDTPPNTIGVAGFQAIGGTACGALERGNGCGGTCMSHTAEPASDA